jgi:hypothetical protein
MQQKSSLVGTMLVGHNATNLSVNPYEGRQSDIGLIRRNARDVLLHRMPGYAVDLAFPIWEVEDVTEMKKKRKHEYKDGNTVFRRTIQEQHVWACNVTLHVYTCTGRNRIIPLMRRPNTDSTPKKARNVTA